MSYKILLTCVGGELAPQIIDCLRKGKHDYIIYGVDGSEEAVGRYFCDYFYKAPKGSDPDYVDFMAKIVRENGIDLLLPGADEEALALCEFREKIEGAGCELACTSFENLQIFADKGRTYEKLRGYGIPVPEWQTIREFLYLEEQLDKFFALHEEIVVKPAVSRGGRDVFIIDNKLTETISIEGGRELHTNMEIFKKEYLFKFKDLLPVVLMEKLIGPVHDVDILGWQGQPLHVIPRRRLDSAVPNAGHIFVEDEKLIEIGVKVIKHFNLSWLYDCDVMFDKKQNPKIIEINPRPSGSSSVCVVAGVPLYDSLVSVSQGSEVSGTPFPTGVKVVPYTALKVTDINEY